VGILSFHRQFQALMIIKFWPFAVIDCMQPSLWLRNKYSWCWLFSMIAGNLKIYLSPLEKTSAVSPLIWSLDCSLNTSIGFLESKNNNYRRQLTRDKFISKRPVRKAQKARLVLSIDAIAANIQSAIPPNKRIFLNTFLVPQICCNHPL